MAIQQQEAQHKKRQSALRIKIISMGAPGVGKSCLIKRYCEEKFVSKYIGTIGVDYGVKVSASCVMWSVCVGGGGGRWGRSPPQLRGQPLRSTAVLTGGDGAAHSACGWAAATCA